MKHLRLLSLLLTIATSTFAQSYELFPNPTDTLSFKQGNQPILFMSFDSAQVNSTQKVYWPHKETAFNDGSNYFCIARVVDTAWFGYKIIQASSGLCRFQHRDYEFEVNLQSTNLQPDSIGWVFFDSQRYTLTAKFKGKSQKTLFNNQLDSVIGFELSAIDTNGNPYQHLTNLPLEFEVSKNHGLVSMPFITKMHYDFPLQPLVTQQRIANYKLMTIGEVYDFEVGDVFHYIQGTNDTHNRIFKNRRDHNITVIGKTQVNADSIFYTIDKKTGKEKLDAQTFTMKYVITRDTIKTGFGSINKLISDKLTLQTDTGRTYKMDPTETIFWLNDTLGRKAIYYVNGIGPRKGNCFEIPFEAVTYHRTVIKGIGLFNYSSYSFPNIYEERLIYFKKASGGTWGNPYYVSTIEWNKAASFKLYPNPANDIVNLEFLEPFQQLEITITDALGRTVMQSVLQEGETAVNIEHLEPGAYFITSQNNTRLPFIKL